MRDLSRPVAELADFFFDPDDRLQMDGCITALTRDGLNVAVMCSHTAALEHYGSMLIARLRQFTPTSKVEVYFPSSPDDLLARFNKALANQSLAQAMQGRKNILATQFWVLNNAASLPEHELQLLASLVQNFPGSNIRLILFMDTARKQSQTLESFGKNILRWDISLPDSERKEHLLAQAKGAAQLKAIRTFLNSLSDPDSIPPPKSITAKTFLNPFGKSKQSMAHPISVTKSRKGTWLSWSVSIAGLLALSVGLMAWFNPDAFSHLSRSAPPPTVAAPDKKETGSTAKGKALEKPKTTEAKVEMPKSETLSNKGADLVDELPNEAAAGEAWVKQLPPGSYVVRHIGLPVFKNVLNWQQANAPLKDGHIVATYKPGDKLAQFVLVTGPYKTRDEATKVTRQPQTPRFAYPITADSLAERLSPRTNNTAEKPKEARR